jgi:hypothetical protein
LTIWRQDCHSVQGRIRHEYLHFQTQSQAHRRGA